MDFINIDEKIVERAMNSNGALDFQFELIAVMIDALEQGGDKLDLGQINFQFDEWMKETVNSEIST